jgi:hypothetical protein
MVATPAKRRSRIDARAETLTIVIPTGPAIELLGVWPVLLMVWTIDRQSFIDDLIHPRPGPGPGREAFAVASCLGLALAGATLVLAVLWTLFGREIIAIDGGRLTVRHQLFGAGRTRAYALDQMTPLRRAQPEQPRFNRRIPNPNRIAFEHGGRTVRCAGGVDDEEADELVALLEARIERWRQARLPLR